MHRRESLYLLLMILALTYGAQIGHTEEKPDLVRILNRMEEAQQHSRKYVRSYTVSREYRFYGSTEEHPKAEVYATISFVPPNEKRFVIERAEGSDRGEKIVRRVLQNEAETAKRDSSWLDRRNYDFALLGRENIGGRPCWVLQLKPKHRETELVEGKAWLDANSYLPRRVEGDMAKSPSWWLKKVHVTVDFDTAAGIWLQTETRAIADVRIFGRHILTAQAVDIRTATETASLKPQARQLAAIPPEPRKAKDNPLRTRKPPAHRTVPQVPAVFGAGVIAAEPRP